MAKQMGIFPIQGTIGNVSFFKTVDGYTVRQKSGISAGRISTDPKFKRTRENQREFGTSAAAAKLVKKAFTPLLKGVADSRMFSRLAKASRLCLNADTINERGARNLVGGNPVLLEGFEFNKTGRLATTLSADYAVSIDRPAGTVRIELADFVPQLTITEPQGSTHFALVAGAAELDFAAALVNGGTARSAILPLGNDPAENVLLECAVPAGTALPVAVVFGILFYQSLNGSYYPLNNSANNALAIVRMDV